MLQGGLFFSGASLRSSVTDSGHVKRDAPNVSLREQLLCYVLSRNSFVAHRRDGLCSKDY
jgi:hypothetical protein